MHNTTDTNRGLEMRTPAWALFLSLAFAFVANAAGAEPVADDFRMMAIEDLAMGHLIVAGDYTAAIEQLDGRPLRRAERFAAINNLCVAYTMAEETGHAVEACNAAVLESQRRRSFAAAGDGAHGRHARIRNQAIALSNRGVLRLTRGDEAGARADFAAAIELGVRIDEPAVNLARLESRGDRSVSAL